MKSTPPVPCLHQRAEAAAEDEQEQQRLDDRGDDARRIAAEADHLALPHDQRGADFVAEAALGDGDLGDGRHRCLSHDQPLPRPRPPSWIELAALGFRVAERGAGEVEEHVVEARLRARSPI